MRSSSCARASPPSASQWQRLGELAASFGCVEAQEINRFAHFEIRIDQGLPGLAGAQRGEFFRMLLVEVGSALEQLRARLAAKRIAMAAAW